MGRGDAQGTYIDLYYIYTPVMEFYYMYRYGILLCETSTSTTYTYLVSVYNR